MNIGFNPKRTAMKLVEWRSLHYCGSNPPSVRTLKKWIDDPKNKDFVGYNQGSMYFLYLDNKENSEDMAILNELGVAV